ncbi:Uncharacterised protein [Actinobacillus pleuropneumoniae]|nr:Uncharacterised protein [Actinobacillus pleuropneumoniae]
MNEKPYNPGMSEEAWNNLHKLIARLSIKYANKIGNEEVEEETNDNANNRS